MRTGKSGEQSSSYQEPTIDRWFCIYAILGEHFTPGARHGRGVVHRIGWPVKEHDSQPEAYCVHVWIRGIHPMLWRRFLVRSDSTLADLHVLLQIGFDWTDFHLLRFRT